MKNLLITTAAVVLFSASTGFATPSLEGENTLTVKPTSLKLQMFADKDGGGNSGGGGSDDGADHDSNDDHGGNASGNDDRDDDKDDDKGGDKKNSDKKDRDAKDKDKGTQRNGGRKPRIPGGSGCDSAADLAEHPECRV